MDLCVWKILSMSDKSPWITELFLILFVVLDKLVSSKLVLLYMPHIND